MRTVKMYTSIVVILLLAYSIRPVIGQNESKDFLYGDLLPDAPELADRGDYLIGVRTLELIHKHHARNQL